MVGTVFNPLLLPFLFDVSEVIFHYNNVYCCLWESVCIAVFGSECMMCHSTEAVTCIGYGLDRACVYI